MEKEELTELCKIWTEYLQCSSGSTDVRYFIREDGQLMYEDEDEDFYETTEQSLINDINDTFEDFLRGKLKSWIMSEYIEEVLGIDYDNQRRLWLEVAEVINHIGEPRSDEFCMNKIKDKFWSPFQRADYLLQALD